MSICKYRNPAAVNKMFGGRAQWHLCGIATKIAQEAFAHSCWLHEGISENFFYVTRKMDPQI
jgi:hypothetical protein